ncbi:iron complex transport system permease protein [Bacillus sp. OV322]|uniref:FecCD family ABC transporter permease n=1 Tax=Bacillus sp. OV322 TaxID=1882764 RepID=UPI0008E1E0FF|nr:iron ABC transporter permease [Bacillus sp. OV322]SFC86660.1 iron complex transport system permease protein [Bacillus sp. OV322]
MDEVIFAEMERRKRIRRITVLSILTLAILVIFFISMDTGYTKLSPSEVFKTLFGMGDEKQSLILFEFRLPRIIISILIGSGLAVSGCVLQGVTRNPLADPGILGITAGAGLLVVLFISFYPNSMDAPVLFLPFLALLGGGMAAALIYMLTYKKNEGLLPGRLLLNGIGVSAGISALMIVLMLKLNPRQFDFLAVWLAGSIWGTSWKHVLTLLPWILLLIPYVIFKSRSLDVLGFGDQLAAGLGMPVEKERLKLLAAAVFLAAASVSVSGGIGFIGLIGPHMAKRLIGTGHKYLIPASALTGSLLLIAADTIGRTVLQPSEIHAGIVVAIIGAPYFLFLLSRSKA